MKDLQIEDQLNSIVREYSKIDKSVFINGSTFYQHSDNPAVISSIEKIRDNLLKLKKELETLRDTDFAGVISVSEQVSVGKTSVSPEMIEFSCPHCDQYIETEREWIGMQASCPACGEVITISDNEMITPVDASSEEQAEKRKCESTEARSEKLSNAVIFLSSGWLITGVCIFSLFLTPIGKHSGREFAGAMIGSTIYFIVVGIIIAIYQMAAKISVKCTNCSTERLLSFDQNNGIPCEVCGSPLFFSYSSFFVLNLLKLCLFIIPFWFIAILWGPASIMVIFYALAMVFTYALLRP